MGQICLTTYDKKIHQSINLNFTLRPLDSIEGIITLISDSVVHDNHIMHTGCVLFEQNFIVLNSTSAIGCTTVSKGTCDGDHEMNITVMATYEGMGEISVIMLQPFINITLCKHFCCSINTS